MNGWFQFVVSVSARPFTVDDYESCIWDKWCRMPDFHPSLCFHGVVLHPSSPVRHLTQHHLLQSLAANIVYYSVRYMA
jgi:hypothetical protein